MIPSENLEGKERGGDGEEEGKREREREREIKVIKSNGCPIPLQSQRAEILFSLRLQLPVTSFVP